MASSRLYNDALAAFKAQMLQELKPGKEHELLENFLATREAPQRAAEEARSLKVQTNKKWSDRKVGKVTVPAHWIDKIMENIQNFINIGNFVMEGAPESAGLAWLAVRLTLSAIQGNYELYSLFGTGLTDITEIMVLIPHYDQLYDNRSAKSRKGDSLVGILFDNITEAYIAVLRFSFEIKRHVTASPLTKVTHVVADFFGASKLKFQDLLDKIKTRKLRVLEYSMAAYQDKSLKFNERQEADMELLKNKLDDMQSFHDSEKKYREEFIAEIHAVKQSIESTTKSKTPWDFAIANFEKTKKKLNPDNSAQEALATALSRRFEGTCHWILKDEAFIKWYQAQSNELLWVTGREGTGKSTLLGFVIEHLCESMDKDSTIPIYFSCETNKKGRIICNTLLYQVYTQAKTEENEVLLLEACNAVFSHPKSTELANVRGNEPTAKTRRGIAHIVENDDGLAEFAVAMPKLSTLLKRSVIVVIDAVDSLQADDQKYLIDQIRSVLTAAEEPEAYRFQIKILVGCRVPLKSAYSELNIENHNHGDMKTRLSAALKSLQGMPQETLENATDTILKKAGPSFSYITEIGIPFIRQPFQGPLDKRLELLPEPRAMSNTYNDAIQKMEPNYLDLLRVAVTWCLLAPSQRLVTIEVVFDVFRGTYQTEDLDNETLIAEHDDRSFPLASHLEKSQLEDTQGPFLDLELNDTSQSFISLRNFNQVRDFCVEGASQEHLHELPRTDERHICSRCGVSMSGPKDLIISEKEGHLDIVLASLRHLNNPLFQKRAQLLFNETSTTIGQSVKDEADKGHGQPTEDYISETLGTGPTENTEKGKDVTVEVDISSKDASNNDTSNRESPDEKDSEEAKEKSDDKQDAKTEDAGNDSDSDGSIDEEDFNEADVLASGSEEDHDPIPEFTSRYEIQNWPYHLRRAEELWSEDERTGNDKWTKVFTELDRLCENKAVFGAWQRIFSYEDHSDYLRSPRQPLHVASYLSLTSWAKQLLDCKQDPNELSGPYNALQAATLRDTKLDMLKLLLERGGDINAESEDARPAFYSWIIQDSSVEAIKLMLEHGANPLVHDKLNGFTALHHLAWTGQDPNALSLILSHPSVKTDRNYINSKSRDLDTPLHVLFWRKEVPTELLKAFLDHGSSVNEDDNYSRRPLQLASIWGELKCLEVLLRDAELIDDDDNWGNTSLHYSAQYGHIKCVDLLVRKGANINRVNKVGRTPIHEAAWAGQKECVEKLLEHGADINPTDEHNRNVLFYACQGDSQETAVCILDKLLEEKVAISEINKVTKGLRTPLRQAASAGYERIIEKLVAGAKANNDMTSLQLDQADTRHGMTPLHRAAWHGYNECVRALLQAGADAKIPIKDENAKTALVLAYEKWALSHQSPYEDTIFQLIEKDPLAAKDDAELLSLCAANGSIRIIRQLQGIGADFSLRDQYGWTPLELARKYQRTEVEEMLKKQTAWTGLLPSRWQRSDLKDNISEDGLTITRTDGSRVCVTTDRPLPAGLDDFYFEITRAPLETQHKVDYPEFAIGFCTLRGDTIDFPGWPPEDRAKSAASWAYHGDNGGFYCSTGNGTAAFSDSNFRYRSGDTVGCGVDLTTGKIWFTKNGELLKFSFKDVHGRLFPVVGLRQPVRFSTTFAGPFKWNRDAEHDGDNGDASTTAGIPLNVSE
ncbi:ankyrin repeat-containing domain protein [Xylaria telfairii]|nr:ankyrin repeat-containing domain protein [Xylaria telfairii]